VLSLHDGSLGLDSQKPSGFGQFNPSTGPNEQRASKFLLKSAYLHAQCRLHDVKLLRRTAEVPLVSNGEKVAKVAQVHGEFHVHLN
jgi:hypothetical protein